MVTENNSQINTFIEGMNSDTSYQMIKDSLYTSAKNVRTAFVDNSLGELKPIEGVVNALIRDNFNVVSILAATSIRDYGIIIAKRLDNTWSVLRFKNAIGENNDYKNSTFNEIKHIDTIFYSNTATQRDVFSIVCNYEDEDNIKLYIADGDHPIMLLNIAPSQDDYNAAISGNIDNITSYPAITFTPPTFEGFVSGNVKAGMVQYSYLLYNKYGIQSEISPTTKLIPIISRAKLIEGLINDKKTKGYLKDDASSIGVKLTINALSEWATKIRIYRIHYAENGQLPTIELILDTEFISGQNVFVDSGQEALSTLTLEEYNSISGVHIIPDTIESMQDYMFAGNIKIQDTNIDLFSDWDARAFRFNSAGRCVMVNPTSLENDVQSFEYDGENTKWPSLTADCYIPYNDVNKKYTYSDCNDLCIYQISDSGNYWGGIGKNISWRFVVAELPGDTTSTGEGSTGQPNNKIEFKSYEQSQNTIPLYYIEDDGFLIKKANNIPANYQNILANTYADEKISYNFKSLRRGEIYRYGIVLYDKYGYSSPVKWIADIRVPDANYPITEPFVSNIWGNNLTVRPIGIEFEVNNLPEDCVSYEIVRCNRKDSDIHTITQGVVSRPARVYKTYNEEYSDGYFVDRLKTNEYSPFGLLTVSRYFAGTRRNSEDDTYYTETKELGNTTLYKTNILNTNAYQFISPEVCYLPEYIKSETKNKLLNIHPINYLFGCDNTFNGGRFGNTNDNSLFIPTGHVTGNLFYTTTTTSGKNLKNTDGIKIPSKNFIDFLDVKLFPYSYVIGVKEYAAVDKENILIPNLNDGDVSEYKPDSYVEATPKTFIYTKLYEQCPQVSMYNHLAGSYNFLKNDTNTENVELDTDVFIRKINNFTIAGEYTWSDYDGFSGDADSGFIADNPKFESNITVFGGNTFNNWTCVLYPPHAVHSDYINQQRTSIRFYESGQQDWYMKVLMGVGGRCAVFNMETNNDSQHPFYDTVYGTKLIKYFEAYQNGDLQQNLRNVSDSEEKCSRIGTYLCNIEQYVTPYGGFSYEDRKLNTYSSYGDFFPSSQNTAIVFDGDCYIMPLDYVSMHKIYNDKIPCLFTTMIGYAIPVETSINLAYTSGVEFSRNDEDNSITNVQIEPSNIGGVWSQEEPLYAYNSAYSVQPQSRTFAAYTEDNESYNDTVDYRVFNSLVKENNEQIDNWTKFLSTNYIDVDTRFGQITHLRCFHNKLIFWQENATGILGVNERTTISTETNLPLIIGTGGILDRFDYLDETGGMHKQEHCDTISDSNLYWFDDDHSEIKQYGDKTGIVPLSKVKNVQNMMNGARDEQVVPTLFYDRKYGEVVSNVLGDSLSIVYNEYIQRFTSLYTVNFLKSITFKNGIYLLRGDIDGKLIIAQWNVAMNDKKPRNLDQSILHTYISYVVNKQPLYTKVFDNLEIITSNLTDRIGIEGITDKSSNEIDKESYFSKNHNYTWRTDINGSTSNLKDLITLREGNYRFAVPRQEGQEYGNRIRGKYMVCEIENTSPDLDVSISYIITKFRVSWN